jgi:hypothetical protein
MLREKGWKVIRDVEVEEAEDNSWEKKSLTADWR